MRNDNGSPALSYYLPEPVKVHTVLHIPGSHTLYIGPSACTRRHAIHAMQYGDRRDVSFLFITEADVVSGDYENLIEDAIGELLAVLDPAPHIFFLGVFCINHFLGTDEVALMSRLRARFPPCQFAMEHIDPVTIEDDDIKKRMNRHTNMYSFLVPEKEHDEGITFLGTFVSLEPECEFVALLREWGAGPVRELFNCKTYAEYQAQARSALAIGMRLVGDETVRFMTEELHIPYYYFPTSYDAAFVANGYQEIAALLGRPKPDLAAAAADAERDARETARLLGGMPIALDSSAFILPFFTAKALLHYGFNVRHIFRSRRLFDFDIAPHADLVARHREIEILWSDDYTNTDPAMAREDCLAIGADSARLLGANRFADIWHDEGYFGFHGIHRLMALLRDCAGVKADGVRGCQ